MSTASMIEHGGAEAHATAFFAVAETSGLYLIHLENLSMAMYTYRKPPGAGLKGPIMSSPQHAKGQELGWSAIPMPARVFA